MLRLHGARGEASTAVASVVDPSQTPSAEVLPVSPPPTVPTTTPTVRRAAAALAVLVAVGVLLQSFFAGSFLSEAFGASGWAGARTLHELGANATFGVLLVEGLLVLATPLRRRRQHLLSGVVLGVLLTAVIGLGYVGGASVAVHVPLGVLTFGVALWHVVAAMGLRLDAADER